MPKKLYSINAYLVPVISSACYFTKPHHLYEDQGQSLVEVGSKGRMGAKAGLFDGGGPVNYGLSGK